MHTFSPYLLVGVHATPQFSTFAKNFRLELVGRKELHLGCKSQQKCLRGTFAAVHGRQIVSQSPKIDGTFDHTTRHANAKYISSEQKTISRMLSGPRSIVCQAHPVVRHWHSTFRCTVFWIVLHRDALTTTATASLDSAFLGAKRKQRFLQLLHCESFPGYKYVRNKQPRPYRNTNRMPPSSHTAIDFRVNRQVSSPDPIDPCHSASRGLSQLAHLVSISSQLLAPFASDSAMSKRTRQSTVA